METKIKGHWVFSESYGYFGELKMHFLEEGKDKCLCGWKPNFQYCNNRVVELKCKKCLKKLDKNGKQ